MRTTETARQAWSRYVSTGAIVTGLLREPVRYAWERAHELGANPHAMKADRLSTLETERLRTREQALMSAARPFLQALSSAAGAERHAVMLADAHAVVLDVVGDEESVHGRERVPGPGALCSEEVSGSNGLGTPLAMGSYAELVGPEHFISGFHAFTCQGIPLMGPDGRVAGVLSTSVRTTAASRRLREILVCAAHAIEAELLLERMELDIRKVLSAPEDARAREALRRDVEQARRIARAGVREAARRVTWSPLEDTLHQLRLADEALLRVHRNIHLWHALASSVIGEPRPVALTALVEELTELMRTEAVTQGVELVLREREPVTVEADAHVLARELLHRLLDAFTLAGIGGAVQVDVRLEGPLRTGSISILPVPAMGLGAALPIAQRLSYPAVFKVSQENTLLSLPRVDEMSAGRLH
jgi:sigma-54 dependent transcriptional regulator, acetoin dehydrogenase operon transcriptional activator AcoR